LQDNSSRKERNDAEEASYRRRSVPVNAEGKLSGGIAKSSGGESPVKVDNHRKKPMLTQSFLESE